MRNSGPCSHGLDGGALKEESRRVDEGQHVRNLKAVSLWTLFCVS